MTRMILSGCNGRMGHVIAQDLKERTDCKIIAGIDIHTEESSLFPVYTDPMKIDQQADVLIDFSNSALLSSLLQYGKKKNLPLVLCTTGYNNEQVNLIKETANSIPIFYSRNMSIGINLLIALSKRAAQILGNRFDIEIIEKHHNQKLDAPSGTALMIADAISTVKDQNMNYTYDRHSQIKKRETSEIGIHSVRGGTIVGEHEVIFAGPQEVITLAHFAQSKEVFANGAVNAAIYLVGKPAGLYDMSDLLK